MSAGNAPPQPVVPAVAGGQQCAAASTPKAATNTAEAQPLPPDSWKLASRATKPEDTVVRVGPVAIGGHEPFVIMAGPCSVETPEQVSATARHVRGHGARILRGGVFKPRTSPYSFQGLGFAGLDLLARAGHENGMPVVTEVMAPEQVERVAAVSDILQIGARNMQNFDLLKECGRARKPVLLKRGLSASVDELLSAAEYVLAHGNQDVILCERGIRTFETSMRATLDLGSVVVLRERTHLPVIVDPSHAAGKRRWVAPLARAAKAIGAHGIIVEVHPDPPRALSDAEQALSFEDFAELVASLAT
ncbi:MAG: 3-deoxy-7-phosphoheptulonate synthase [Planctomycetota bacterium]